MNNRLITTVSVAAAVIALAVAGIVVTIQRTKATQLAADAARAQADKAEATAKAADRQAKAEAEKSRQLMLEKDAAHEQRLANEKAESLARLELKTAEEKRRAAEAESQAAQAASDTARATRDAEAKKLEAARVARETAQKKVDAEALVAQAEADRLAAEKLKSDKIIAEAKLFELRQIDFATMERELVEWKQELEERERALAPEKTIANLAWAGGTEDSIIDAEGNVRKQEKVPYLAENDAKLPVESRRLAKVMREANEASAARAAQTREAIVRPLEGLYVAAVKEGRVVDAEFYRKSLKSLYPDWEFKGEGTK